MHIFPAILYLLLTLVEENIGFITNLLFDGIPPPNLCPNCNPLQLQDETISPPSLDINGSWLVDIVLAQVRQLIISRSMDPLVIPNSNLLAMNDSVALRNGKIKGLSNIHRAGPVMVSIALRDTKFRSGLSVTDVDVDQDVQIKTTNASFPNGHIHMDCENVTGYQVLKLNHLTLALTLDEFEIIVGDFNFKITGLGEVAQKGSKILTSVIDKTKDPVLFAFSVTFKTLFNVALEALRAAILALVSAAAVG